MPGGARKAQPSLCPSRSHPSLCLLPSVPTRLRGRQQPWTWPKPGRAERGGGCDALLGGFPPAAAVSPRQPGSAKDKPTRCRRAGARSQVPANVLAPPQPPARASWLRPADVAAGPVRPPRLGGCLRPGPRGDSLSWGRRSCCPCDTGGLRPSKLFSAHPSTAALWAQRGLRGEWGVVKDMAEGSGAPSAPSAWLSRDLPSTHGVSRGIM